LALSAAAYAASEGHDHVGDEVVTKQRHMLAKTTPTRMKPTAAGR
jgi:hypothetical protein